MATDTRRREFISVLGSAAVWPLALRAQQPDKMRRVGVLPGGYREIDPEGQARIAAFLDTLRKLGWSDGRNVRVEIQWSSAEMDRIREMLWGGDEDIASIVADVNRWSAPCRS